MSAFLGPFDRILLINEALFEDFVLELLFYVLPDLVQASLVGLLTLLLESLVLPECDSFACRFVDHVYHRVLLSGWLDYLNLVLARYGEVLSHPARVLLI